LELPDRPAFGASLHGRLVANPGRAHLTHALRDRIAITVHGVALWLRRLPTQPRPDHHQEDVR
jgi:uncharacterized protein